VGIPTVRDRVGQPACQIVIEPIFEANFQDTSDSLRPRHRATQAVQVVKAQRVSKGYVVDVDIERFFDTIDHDMPRRFVARRISDRRGLKLRRQWWQAGVVEEGQWCPTTIGSPQGGVRTLVVKRQTSPESGFCAFSSAIEMLASLSAGHVF
jgi:RNA-directed DNA polymerase